VPPRVQGVQEEAGHARATGGSGLIEREDMELQIVPILAPLPCLIAIYICMLT
jgi:hypothetical protein